MRSALTARCGWPSKPPPPNVLDRDFIADRPNRKLVTDISYLPTLAGWMAVAVVLDLYSRKVVGWSRGDSLATPLVAASRRRARWPRPIVFM
jgi:putative transposase